MSYNDLLKNKRLNSLWKSNFFFIKHEHVTTSAQPIYKLGCVDFYTYNELDWVELRILQPKKDGLGWKTLQPNPCTPLPTVHHQVQWLLSSVLLGIILLILDADTFSALGKKSKHNWNNFVFKSPNIVFAIKIAERSYLKRYLISYPWFV